MYIQTLDKYSAYVYVHDDQYITLRVDIDWTTTIQYNTLYIIMASQPTPLLTSPPRNNGLVRPY